jgi:hypothetical protein
MPVKRRLDKRRPEYPETIEQLAAGGPIEWSPQAWDELLGAYFFHDYNLAADALERARWLLDEWHDRQLAHERIA